MSKQPSQHAVKAIKIGEAARILGVSVKTLRRWEEAKKIKSRRTPGGTRFYSLNSLKKVNPALEHLYQEEVEPVVLASKEIYQRGSVDTETLLKKAEQALSSSVILNPKGEGSLANASISGTSPEILRSAQNDKEGKNDTIKRSFFTKFLIGSAFLSFLTLFLTGSVISSYLINPRAAQRFYQAKAAVLLSPFHTLAEGTMAIISPQKAKELGLVPPDNPPPIPYTLNPVPSNVLAETASSPYLEINENTLINGSLSVRDSINGLVLEATASAGTMAFTAGETSLTVTKTAKLDQDVSTTSSPAFSALKLSSTKDQLVLATNGTLTWTPTAARTITLPDLTTTLVGKDTTDTLTNKSMSGSSNTFTNLPNSALTNNKITVTSGTNLTGGGDIVLGGSATIALKDSITLTGTLAVGGASTLSSTLAVTGATTLSSTLSVTGATTLSGNVGIGFTGSATTIYPDLGLAVAGNIGIGTTSPQNRLQVLGNGVFGANYGAYSAPGNGMLIEGNVGIGSTGGVNYNLDVWGNTRITGALTVGGSFTAAGDLLPTADNIYNLGSASQRWASLHVGPGSVVVHNDTSDTNWSKLDFAGTVAQLVTDSATPLQLVTGTNNLGLYINTSGNVGIGTSSPDYTFKTQGTGYFSSFVGIGSSMNVSGNVGIGTSLNVASASILDSLSVTKSISAASLGVTGTSSLSATTVTSLQNSGGTLFGTLSVADKPTGGDIGIAAATVDIYTSIALNQTTASQTITLPNPTNATAGRIVYLSNTGSASFTFLNSAVQANTTTAALWNGTEWTLAGGGGLAPGTTNNSTLRWNSASTQWVENGNILSTADGNIGINGRLGVGTTANPDYNFKVLGTGYLSGFLGVGSSMSVSGNVGIGASVNVTSAGIFGSLGTSTLSVSGDSNLSTLTTSGNVGIGKTLSVVGLTYALGGLRVDGFSDLTGNVGIGSSLTVSSAAILDSLSVTKSISAATIGTSGNVGIGGSINVVSAGIFGSLGTSTLSVSGASTFSTLTVSGNVGLGASASVTSLLSAGSLSSSGSLVVSGTSFLQAIYGSTLTATGNITTEGNLGIGTSVPNARLSVQGNVGIGYTGINQVIPANGLAVSGNVGIGTTTANSNLSVVGNAHIGSLRQGISAPADGLLVDGNVGIGATSTAYNLDIWGTGRFSSALTVGGNIGVGTSINVSSAGIFGSLGASTLSVSGNSTLSTLTVSGNVGLGASVSVTSNLDAGSISTSTLSVSGDSNLSTLTTSGNVGIGKTVSVTGLTYALGGLRVNGYSDLTGNVGIGGTATFNSLMVISGHLLPSADDTYDLGADSFRWRDTYLGPGTLHIGTSTVDEYTLSYDTTNNRLGFNANDSGPAEIVMDSNGNLGIGTTNPLAKLHVSGSTTTHLQAESDSQLIIKEAITNGISLRMGVDSDANFAWLQAVEANVSADRALVLNPTAGNVGIGTTTANSTLSVVGKAHIGSVRQGISAPTDGLLVDGNVGIGATTSTNKLDVWGNARITGALTVDGDFTLGGSNTGSQFLANDGSFSAPGYSFKDDNDSGLWRPGTNLIALTTNGAGALQSGTTINGLSVNSTGNIGIGTTSPDYTFRTQGTGYFSGFLGIGSSMSVSGNVGIGGSLTTTGLDYASGGLRVNGYSDLTGNVGIGGTATFNSLMVISGNLLPSANDTYDLGSDALRWNNLYLGPSTLHIGSSISDEYTLSYDTTNDRLGFNVNGSGPAEVVMNSSGNVGIGTTGPVQRLQVNPNGTSAIVITSGGNLGIGNTSPASPVDITPSLTTGTIFNMAYAPTTTLTGSLTGWSLDLNSGNVLPSNNSVTGATITLPTTTTTSGSSSLKGLVVAFGSGSGINNNSAGTLTYTAADLSMPALTQTQGTLTANGVLVTTPTSITTGGTANAINVSATGVGAGSLNAVNIGTITGGDGTEIAVNVASGWDTVLKVGSTTVINGSGVTQVAGGGTGKSSYTIGDLLYASDTGVLTNLGIGTSGQVLATTAGLPVWANISGSSCVNCLTNNPTGTQNLSPSGQATTGLSIRQTSTADPSQDIFNVTDSTGATKYFYVDKDGNVSSGSVSSTTITLTPGSDTTALTLVGTNVTTQSLAYFNSKNAQGTIFNIAYGTNQTLTGSLTGQAINFTNLGIGASNQSVTGTAITMPGVTNANTEGTKTYTGVNITTSSGLNQTGAGATISNGISVTIPALTQTAGSLTGNGVLITTPSSITTGGTASGLNISATGVGAGILYGINLSGISGGAGTETAFILGSGWDTLISNANFTVKGDGNVGIGTSAPTYQLQTTGNVGLGASVSVTSNLDAGSIAATTLSVSGNTTMSTLTTSGNVGIGKSLSIVGLTYALGGLRVDGFSDLTGNIGIGGTANFNSLVYSTGSFLSANGSATTPGYSFTNSTSTGLWSPSSNALSLTTNGSGTSGLTITAGGNVGIGMTNPAGLLDVNGKLTVLSGGSVGIGTANIPHGGVGAAKLAIEGTDASTAGPHIQLTTAADDYPLLQILGYQHDNVGIRFDSYWDGSIKSSDPGSSFSINKNNDQLALQYGVAAAGSGLTFNPGIVLTSTGNVGIGVTTVNSLLSVAGGAHIGSVRQGITAPTDGLLVDGNVGIGTSTANSLLSVSGGAHIGSLYQGTVAPTNGLFVDGNVGIGATTSSNKLDVWGNARIAGTLTADGNTSLANTLTALSSTGYVGIGTTAPSSKFQLMTNASGNQTLASLTTESYADDQEANMIVGTLASSANSTILGHHFKQGASTDYGYLELYGGTRALAWDFYGNVGIGFTSPAATLDVIGTSLLRGTGGTYGLTVTSAGNIGIGITNPVQLFQLNPSASNPFVITSGGNVGIGFTSPTTKLQLHNGQLRLSIGSGRADTDGKFIIDGRPGTGYDGVNPNISFYADTTSYGPSISFYDNTGTTIYGRVMMDRASEVYTGANQNDFVLGTEASTNSLHLGTNANVRLTVDSSGNVGIGTTTANSLLSVAGGAHIGSIRQGISAPTDGLLVDGNVGIGATSTAYNLDIWGTQRLTGALTVGGNIGVGASVNTSSAGIFGSLRVNGFSDLTGNVGIGGTANFNSLIVSSGHILPSADDNLDLGSNTARWRDTYLGPGTLHIGTSISDEYTLSYDTTGNYLGFNVNGSGAAEITMDSSGNLGIGVTSPTQALELAGTMLFRPTAASGQKGCIRFDATNQDLEYSNDCTTFQSLGATAGGWSDQGTYTRLTTTSANVGIGFSGAPDRKLSLANDIDITSTIASLLGTNGSQFSITGSSADGLQKKLTLGLDTTNNYGVIQAGNTDGTAYNLALQPGGGNVGIGFTSPNQALQVASAPSAATSLANILGANGSQLSLTGSTSTTLLTKLAIGMDTTNNFGYLQAGQNGAASNLILEPNGGNVGIGTTSPGYRLTVDKAFTAYSDFGIYLSNATNSTGYLGMTGGTTSGSNFQPFIEGKNAGGTTTGLQLRGVPSTDTSSYFGVELQVTNPTNDGAATAANALRVRNWATTLLTIDAAGNMGIGTASPLVSNSSNGHSLDISGTGTFTSIARVGTTSTNGAGLLTAGRSDGSAFVGNGPYYDMQNNLWKQPGEVTSSVMQFDNNAIYLYTGTASTSPTMTVRFKLTDSGIITDNTTLTAQGAGTINAKGLFVDGVAVSTAAGNYWTSATGGIQYGSNVGIGTASPGAPLDVTGNTFLDATWVNGILAIGANQNAGIVRYGTNGLGFRVGDVASKVVFDDNGNVGIGTSTFNSFTSGIQLQPRARSKYGFLMSDLDGSDAGALYLNGNGSGSLYLMDGSGNTNILLAPTADSYIATANNLGIGTSSPGRLLHVAGTGTSQTSSPTGYTTVGYFDTTDTNGILIGGNTLTGVISPDATGADFAIYTSSSGTFTDRLHISAAGNVGIGFTSPKAALMVQGSGTGYVNIGQLSDATNYGAINFSLSTLSAANYNFTGLGGDLLINRITGSAIRFRENNGDDQMTIAAGGNITMSGNLSVTGSVTCGSGCAAGPWSTSGSYLYQTSYNVGIGTATPSYILHASDATAGDQTTIAVFNTDNTNSASRARLLAVTGGTSAGDPFVNLAVTGGSEWSIGLDNSDSDKFKIAQSGGLGTLDKFTIQTDGNVGIGTASPTSKLYLATDTSTDAKFVMETASGGTDKAFIFFDTHSTDWSLGTAVDDKFHIVQNSDISGGAKFTIDTNGNVGIGTSNPGAGLHMLGGASGVRDELRIETTAVTNAARLRLINNAGGDWYVGAGAINGNSNFQIAQSGDGGSMFNILTGGNVGIGDATPSYKLEVGGSFNATSVYSNGSLLTPGTGSNWTVSGSDIYRSSNNVGIGPNTPGAVAWGGTVLTINSNSDVNNALEFWTNTDSASDTRNPGIITWLAGTGKNRVAEMHGEIEGTSENSGVLRFKTNNAGGGITEHMRISRTGNIGMGTTVPQAKLVIQGNVGIGYTGVNQAIPVNGLAVFGNVGIGATTANNKLQVIGSGLFSSTWGGAIAPANGLIVEGSTGIGTSAPSQFFQVNPSGTSAFVVTSSGSVGIGFTSPAATLDVIGTSMLRGSAGVLGLTVTSAGSVGIGITAPVATFQVNPSSSNPLVFTSGGNLGIGITSPNQTLNLAGTMGIRQSQSDNTQGCLRYNSSTLQLQWSNDCIAYQSFSAPAAGGWTYDSINNYVRLTTSSSNVGIGFTSPIAKLQVTGGNILIDNNKGFMGKDTGGTARGLISSSGSDDLDIGASNGWNTIRFWPGTTEMMRITNTGNVGIGFTSPTANLHIVNTAAQDSFRVDDIANDDSPFVINQSGSVGIGFTSPATKLHVFGSEPGIRLQGTRATGGAAPSRWDIKTELSTTAGIMPLIFAEAAGGEVMRLQSNGNVGIGEVAPKSLLQLGTDSASIESNGELTLARANGAGAARKFRIGLDANYNLSIGDFGYYGVDTYVSYMTIQNSGNVGIGTTNPTVELYVSGDTLAQNKSGATVSWIRGNAGTMYLGLSDLTNNNSVYLTQNNQTLYFRDNSGDLPIRFNLTDGAVEAYKTGGGSWADSSDIRLKKNITSLEDPLDKILSLRPISYEWINPEQHTPGTHAGFIAQEVQGTFPAWVNETAPQGNDASLIPAGGKAKTLYFPSDFNALVVGAIQEQQGQINSLQSSVLSLQTTSASQSATLSNLSATQNGQGLTLDRITRAMMVTDTGNIGIGTTTPQARLQVTGDSGQLFSINNSTSSLFNVSSTGNVGIGTSNPQFTLEINGTGKLNDAGWTYASDIRLKENVASIEGPTALSVVEGLNPVTFDYINGGKDRSGFIAQEVQGVLPNLVTTGSDGMLGIRLEEMMPYVVKAIQEQQDEITNYKFQMSNQIQNLNDQIAELKNILNIQADGTIAVSHLKAGVITLDPSLVILSPKDEGSLANASSSNELRDSSLIAQNDIGGKLASLEDRLAALEKAASTTSEVSASSQSANSSEVSMTASASAQIAGEATASASLHLPGEVKDATVNSHLEGVASTATSSATPSAQTSSEVGFDSSEVNLHLTPPDLLLASDSAALIDTFKVGPDSLKVSDANITDKLTAYDLDVQNALKSLGKTTLGDTLIAGDLTVDGTMSVSGNSINAVGAPLEGALDSQTGTSPAPTGILYIQNSPLAQGVDFFNGLVTIDKTGKLVAQEIVAKTVTTNKLIISNTADLHLPGESQATPSAHLEGVASEGSVRSASIGSAIIPAGSIDVPINTTAITANSKIFITASSPTGGQIPFISYQEANIGFIVALEQAYSRDIRVNWWIVDTN